MGHDGMDKTKQQVAAVITHILVADCGGRSCLPHGHEVPTVPAVNAGMVVPWVRVSG